LRLFAVHKEFNRDKFKPDEKKTDDADIDVALGGF
jgi:hypothetical protein